MKGKTGASIMWWAGALLMVATFFLVVLYSVASIAFPLPGDAAPWVFGGLAAVALALTWASRRLDARGRSRGRFYTSDDGELDEG